MMNGCLIILSLFCSQSFFLFAGSQSVFTIVGDGTAGNNDGQGTSARINGPSACIPDGQGNFYIFEQFGYRIRKMNASFYVSSWVGNGAPAHVDGQGTQAGLRPFHGVYDSVNERLLVGDINGVIRSINTSGYVSTIAGTGASTSIDGPATSASFNGPFGFAFDSNRNLYFSDSGGHKVRKMTPSGVVSTFAGSGTGGATNDVGILATFKNPYGIAIDQLDNLYVVEFSNNDVRKITTSATVSTFAGGLAWPNDIVRSPVSGDFFVANNAAGNIKKITSGGVSSTYAGDGVQRSVDGIGLAASFSDSSGINSDSFGNLYVADRGSHTIRKICNDTCPPGHQFTASALCCVPCSTGSYQASGGQTSCISCPSNSICLSTGLTDFQCSSGYYRTGSNCTICPNGMYQPAIGQTSCISCPSNSICSSTGLTDFQCKSGYYRTGSNCTICPRGTYQPLVGQTQCTPCPTNSECNGSGLQDFACQAGHYRQDFTCIPCTAGTFKTTPDSSLCKPCPDSSYQPSTGQISCLTCPSNATCTSTAFTCSTGFYRAGLQCLPMTSQSKSTAIVSPTKSNGPNNMNSAYNWWLQNQVFGPILIVIGIVILFQIAFVTGFFSITSSHAQSSTTWTPVHRTSLRVNSRTSFTAATIARSRSQRSPSNPVRISTVRRSRA